jgi:hypothetical protein
MPAHGRLCLSVLQLLAADLLYAYFISPTASSASPRTPETPFWLVHILAAPLLFPSAASARSHLPVLAALHLTRFAIEALVASRAHWLVAVGTTARELPFPASPGAIQALQRGGVGAVGGGSPRRRWAREEERERELASDPSARPLLSEFDDEELLPSSTGGLTPGMSLVQRQQQQLLQHQQQSKQSTWGLAWPPRMRVFNAALPRLGFGGAAGDRLVQA